MARPDILRTRLATVTSGDDSCIPSTDENVYVKNLMDGQIAEQEEAQKALKTLHGCRIISKMRRRKMWLQIYPCALPNKLDEEFDQNVTTLHYRIDNSNMFLNDPNVLRQHPVLINPEGSGWQVTLEPDKLGTEATFCGTIDNVFTPDYKRFEGEEEGVILEPLFNGVGGGRGLAALREFENMCNETARDIVGCLRKDSKQSKLPLRELVLPGLKFIGADNDQNSSSPLVPQAWRERMDESQCRAIEMACSKRISVIHGPAATGRARLLLISFASSIKTSHLENIQLSVLQPMLPSIRCVTV